MCIIIKKNIFLTAIVLVLIFALCSCAGGQKITVNGTEIILGRTTAEDLSASGYTCTADDGLKINARTATIDNPVEVVRNDGSDVLVCSVMNTKDEPVEVLKCAIRGIVVDNGDADFTYKNKNLMETLATLELCKAENSAKTGYFEDTFSDWISVSWYADGLAWYVDYTLDGKLTFISAKIDIK